MIARKKNVKAVQQPVNGKRNKVLGAVGAAVGSMLLSYGVKAYQRRQQASRSVPFGTGDRRV